MELVIATGNRHKLEEFQRILAPLGVGVSGPDPDCPALKVEETGGTFAENARIKAEAYFRATGKPAVADDSGLCVDALDGRPGAYSARYQGADTPYPQKLGALLEELRDVPEEKRTARFVCAICCVLDEKTVLTCRGECEGRIAYAPSGEGGFGYDPVFLWEGKSFAALIPAEKDASSHRGKALRAFAEQIRAHLYSHLQ